MAAPVRVFTTRFLGGHVEHQEVPLRREGQVAGEIPHRQRPAHIAEARHVMHAHPAHSGFNDRFLRRGGSRLQSAIGSAGRVAHITGDARRVADHDGVRWHRPRHHGAGTHHGAAADAHAGEDGRVGADRRARIDDCLGVALWMLPAAREQVVGERRIRVLLHRYYIKLSVTILKM